MAKHYKNQNQNKIIPIKSAREKGKRYKTSQKSGSRFTASVFSRGWKAVRGAVTSAGAAVASVFVKCGEFIGSGLRRQNGRSARSTRGSRYQPRFGQAQKPVRTEPPASTEKTAPVRLKHGRAAREESGRDSVPAAVVPKEKKHEKPVRLDKSGKRKKLKKVNPLTLPENLPSSAQLENELNHDVLIIGWDDSFPTETFPVPAADFADLRNIDDPDLVGGGDRGFRKGLGI